MQKNCITELFLDLILFPPGLIPQTSIAASLKRTHWRNPFMLQTSEAEQQKQMKNYTTWKAGAPSPIWAPHVAFLTP